MDMKKWAEKEIERAKLAEFLDSSQAKTENEKAVFAIENAYADSIYDSALEIFNKIVDQDHSGNSIGFMMQILNRLIRLEALTPLTGEESEWTTDNNFVDENNELTQQNNRNTKVFRVRSSENEPWKYTYNDVFFVINSDEVWRTYPPVNDPGTLDDFHPLVIKYTLGLRRLRMLLNEEIKFPYTPSTRYYKWDFLDEAFVEIKKG